MFITLEGPDGSGKTTQAALLGEALTQQGFNVLMTREPGGTAIGEQIRAVLHDPVNEEMDPVSEVLLYAASRAQHVAQIIRPALAERKVVVCDRYFDSTMAYQGYGHGLDRDMLWQVTRIATGGLVPDLTLFIDLPPADALKRRELDSEGEWNRLDAQTLDFHKRVYHGYRELIELDGERWIIIDGTKSVLQIHEAIMSIVEYRLKDMSNA